MHRGLYRLLRRGLRKLESEHLIRVKAFPRPEEERGPNWLKRAEWRENRHA